MLLGGTRDTGSTAGYWGALEGYWVLEVLWVLWGSAGYCEVPLGSVKYCWVFLGYWLVLRVNGG